MFDKAIVALSQDIIDSHFDGVLVDVENLGYETDLDSVSLPDELLYFLVELFGSKVLIAIGGWQKLEIFPMEFDHDFCYCSFRKWVGFLFLN